MYDSYRESKMGEKMKNRISVLVFLIVGLMLAACSGGNAGSTSAQPAQPTEVVSQGSGFCFNPYFPLRDDKTWTYQSTSGDITTQYTLTFKDISADAFTSLTDFESLKSEVRWNCSADGMLSSQFANLAFQNLPDFQINTVEASGVFFPPADQWQVGKTWQTNFKVNVNMVLNGNSIDAQGEIALDRVINAQEDISVAAGEYNGAYRVDSSGKMTISFMGAAFDIPFEFQEWYASGVGLVKSISPAAEFPYTMELISYQ